MNNADRDLPLPRWGPYSRHYAGMSFLPPGANGTIVDFVPLYGRDRGRTIVPDVHVESDYSLIRATPDLSYLAYRFELRRDPDEHCVVEFFAHDAGLLCTLTYVNGTPRPKSYVTSLMTVIRTLGARRIRPLAGVTWIGAEQARYAWPDGFAGRRPFGQDGLDSGVVVDRRLVDGIGLGNRGDASDGLGTRGNTVFLFHPGTTVTFPLPESTRGGERLVLRAAACGVRELTVTVEGRRIRWAAAGRPADPFVVIDLGMLPAAPPAEVAIAVTGLSLTDSPAGDGGTGPVTPELLLDGLFVLAGEGRAFAVEGIAGLVVDAGGPGRLEYHHDAKRGGVLIEEAAGFAPALFLLSTDERPLPPAPYTDGTVTHVFHDELGGAKIARKLSNDSLLNWDEANCRISGNGANHFLGYNTGPLVVSPQGSRTAAIAIVAAKPGARSPEAGLRAQAERILHDADRLTEAGHRAYRSACESIPVSPYRDAMRSLHGHIFANVTYPVRIGRELVRTYTPGKRWGGLFTWDSGMHGIGMSAYDPVRACGILEQYLPAEADDRVPAVVHGSPLPLHVYLLNEIFQATADRAILRRYFNRAVRYWGYFAGCDPQSDYDRGGIGLLSSYSDGYNSFGVDDYPLQHYEGVESLRADATTVSTTAHAIRTAKILAALSRLVDADATPFLETAAYLTSGLQRLSWNESSGYFEHVRISTGEQIRYPHGGSFNMGIDGVSPYVAGVCTDLQAAAMVRHLMSPDEMWTPYGLTAVSQAAPYFRHDGYWNGKVWVPHQWFVWKAFITNGLFDHAWTVARIALTVFASAHRDTGYSYELFDGRTGMGEGCHQFAGLSAPLASFHAAYFRPGQLTLGFDTTVETGFHTPGRGRFVLGSPVARSIRGLLGTRESTRVKLNGTIVPTLQPSAGRTAGEVRPAVALLDASGETAVLEWNDA